MFPQFTPGPESSLLHFNKHHDWLGMFTAVMRCVCVLVCLCVYVCAWVWGVCVCVCVCVQFGIFYFYLTLKAKRYKVMSGGLSQAAVEPYCCLSLCLDRLLGCTTVLLG